MINKISPIGNVPPTPPPPPPEALRNPPGGSGGDDSYEPSANSGVFIIDGRESPPIDFFNSVQGHVYFTVNDVIPKILDVPPLSLDVPESSNDGKGPPLVPHIDTKA